MEKEDLQKGEESRVPPQKEEIEEGGEKKDAQGFTYVENANASGQGVAGRSEGPKTGDEGSIQKDVY